MRTHLSVGIALLGLLLVGSAPGTRALAQDADALRPLQVEDYFALKTVNDPRISPDGAWVAFTVRSQDLGKTSARRGSGWCRPQAARRCP